MAWNGDVTMSASTAKGTSATRAYGAQGRSNEHE
jgi:hypothetical protein